ncbi:MAG: hypothetical protein MJ202_05890 [Lentisphaeria bacterium]|nr:hypothetical protein [Lentisphaeria bacterium]
MGCPVRGDTIDASPGCFNRRGTRHVRGDTIDASPGRFNPAVLCHRCPLPQEPPSPRREAAVWA